MEGTRVSEVVYVSWGGTGRAASMREAMRRANDQGRPLVYLAVLDDGHFSDLDHSMIAIVADELEWLLDAQIDLTKNQLGAGDLKVRLVVEQGDVVDLAIAEAKRCGSDLVLVGAPVAVAGHDSVESILAQIKSETSAEVAVVLPDFV